MTLQVKLLARNENINGNETSGDQVAVHLQMKTEDGKHVGLSANDVSPDFFSGLVTGRSYTLTLQ